MKYFIVLFFYYIYLLVIAILGLEKTTPILEYILLWIIGVALLVIVDMTMYYYFDKN